MNKVLSACMAIAMLCMFSACSKNEKAITPPVGEDGQNTEAAPDPNEPVGVDYDFNIGVPADCNNYALTIYNCSNKSYSPWLSITNCTTNRFCAFVLPTGNPVLSGTTPKFSNAAVTYCILDNTTSAARDMLVVTFQPGYSNAHKPTIHYNPVIRKFTIISPGNATYIACYISPVAIPIRLGVTPIC